MPKKSMKVLLAGSECSPIVKVGGLGDVIGSLPKFLKTPEVDVRVILPKYSLIDVAKYHFEPVAGSINVGGEIVSIYKSFLPSSNVLIYLLENDKYFKENGVYFDKTAFVRSTKEIERFLFFSRAILEIFPALDWFPDIIHCNDWHTAIIASLLKRKNNDPRFKDIKTLLTIHNLANQGNWQKREIFNFLGWSGEGSLNQEKTGEDTYFNILEQGILNADILNTVSQTYAKEILTSQYGEGLEKSIFSRRKSLFGILNGVDEAEFNPEKDRNIKANYSAGSLEQKKENKLDLQSKVGLTQNIEIPLIGVISRLTSQKGFDLIIEAVLEMVKMGCQLVVLGVGSEDYERKLLALAKEYPNNISVNIRFDAALAQKIYAGSDIFLMPSRFEPCGLGQVISQKYGTLPIVRKTGGLADTVKNRKTGFLFSDYSSGAMLKSLEEALIYFKDKKEWNVLMKRAMDKDFSWSKSAKEYIKLYNKLVKK
jgi:starch synthase